MHKLILNQDKIKTIHYPMNQFSKIKILQESYNVEEYFQKF